LNHKTIVQKTCRVGAVLASVMCLFISAGKSSAASRYWVPTNANWNAAANWSTVSGGAGGASVPGSSDVAFFDAQGTGNCSINAAVDVAGINITGYTATITQLAGNTVTVGASGYSQTSGTFTGGNSSITLNGSFSLSGGTFRATSGNMNSNANWTVSGGTFQHNSGTVIFGNTLTITGSHTLNHVTISGSGTKTLAGTLSVARNLRVSAGTFDLGSFTANRTSGGGTLTVSDGATLSIGGTNTVPSNYSTHSIGATSTINYSGTNQSVIVLNSSQNYGNLTISGSGTKTLAGSVTVRGTLSISGASLANGGYTLSANGDINHATTHTGSGKISLTGGTIAHSLSGGGSYTNLEMNDANGATLSSNVTVNGTLTLTSGNISAGAFTFSISSSGGVSRASGHVVGNLQKYIGTGAPSTTFQIGDASNYTPVDVSFASVSTAGNLIARTTSGDHPNIGSANINAAKSINRYWTLTNSGIVFTTCTATFNFAAGDVDPGTNTNAVIVGKRSGGAWAYPSVGAKTATSTQATSLTTFGDFQIGEVPNLSVSVSNSAFAFGVSVLNTWLTPQTSVILNDGNVAESLVGRISQFTAGSNNWGISAVSNGGDIIRAQWSTTSGSGPWADISAYNADFTIVTNVAVGNSVTFWLRLQTPTSTSSYNEHSSVLTATAWRY